MKYTRLLFVMMLAAAFPLWASGEVNERRSMSPDGLVEVEMISGTIRVIGWDKAEVEITGRLTRPREQLDIDSDGDEVSIEVMPLHGCTAATTISTRAWRSGCRAAPGSRWRRSPPRSTRPI
jgi:hypothetical protein